MRDRYHGLVVKQVVAETADAVSIVFEVPPDLAGAFRYAAGQFVTLRVVVNGERHLRSYSMSSAPAVDADLQVTVKRVPGGVVSNWLNESVGDGDELEVSEPGGAFVLGETRDDIVAFAGGSGVTPIFSIVKTALHTTERRVRVLLANRDRVAAIFGDALDDLAARFPERLTVVHHEDVVDGFVDAARVAAVAEGATADFYICGPAPFMAIVEAGLGAAGVAPDRVHIERFSPADEPVDLAGEEVAEGTSVTITLGNHTETVAQRGRSTILQSARWVGLRAPSSCEAGHCATCMAQVLEGRVEMARNDILTPEEVAEGWILTCQAVPVSPVVRVVYE